MSLNSEIRVRFAPSPTGFLHVGGARTALFNYLFAKKHAGKFILRIEDTDKERSSQEAIDAIIEGMTWLGLSWDEGPFYQSQRTELYVSKVQELLKKGLAYRCFMTKDELDARRESLKASGKPPRYDGREEQLKQQDRSDPHVVRFMVPEGKTTIPDLVKGDVTYDHGEIEDFVLMRSDGSPTYNLVVVVDDIEMRMSHVIRGDDHLNNTTKQILLCKALGEEVPQFAHLPLILGGDKQRLSKRHGATAVQAYRDEGYLPHSMINFLSRLGWSHKDQEIFSEQELIDVFSLESVGKSAGMFNTEKLLWLNQHYIKEASFDVLMTEIEHFLGVRGADFEAEKASAVIDSLRDRAKTTKELAHLARFFFLPEVVFDDGVKEKFISSETKPVFDSLCAKLDALQTFDEGSIEAEFKATMQEQGLKMKQVGMPVRVALTGGTFSPSVYHVMVLLGKEASLARLQSALA